MPIHPNTIEMLAALEEAGVEGGGRNRRCPVCDSSDGVSVNLRRCMAKCFSCGTSFWPRKDYSQSWVVYAMQKMYQRFREEFLKCESVEAQQVMRYLVEKRGVDRQLLEQYEPIGVVPIPYNPSGLIEILRELREKEEQQLGATAKRTSSKKAKQDIEDRLEENERSWQKLMDGFNTLKMSGGALAFFYVNSGFDFISVNLRNPNPDGKWKFRQVKPLWDKGVYSPIGPDDKEGSHEPTTTFEVLPGTCLLVEGEFNLLTLRSAFKKFYEEQGENWKDYLYASAAMGSASTWDVGAARALFSGDEIVINFDND